MGCKTSSSVGAGVGGMWQDSSDVPGASWRDTRQGQTGTGTLPFPTRI